jgi:hypothetical protein
VISEPKDGSLNPLSGSLIVKKFSLFSKRISLFFAAGKMAITS